MKYELLILLLLISTSIAQETPIKITTDNDVQNVKFTDGVEFDIAKDMGDVSVNGEKAEFTAKKTDKIRVNGIDYPVGKGQKVIISNDGSLNIQSRDINMDIPKGAMYEMVTTGEGKYTLLNTGNKRIEVDTVFEGNKYNILLDNMNAFSSRDDSIIIDGADFIIDGKNINGKKSGILFTRLIDTSISFSKGRFTSTTNNKFLPNLFDVARLKDGEGSSFHIIENVKDALIDDFGLEGTFKKKSTIKAARISLDSNNKVTENQVQEIKVLSGNPFLQISTNDVPKIPEHGISLGAKEAYFADSSSDFDVMQDMLKVYGAPQYSSKNGIKKIHVISLPWPFSSFSNDYINDYKIYNGPNFEETITHKDAKWSTKKVSIQARFPKAEAPLKKYNPIKK